MKFVILVVFALAAPAFAGCIELPETGAQETPENAEENDSFVFSRQSVNQSGASHEDDVDAHATTNTSRPDAHDSRPHKNASAAEPAGTNSTAHDGDAADGSQSAQDPSANESSADSANATQASSGDRSSAGAAAQADNSTAGASSASADASANETVPATNASAVKPSHVDRFSGRVEPGFLGIVGTVSPARTVTKSIQVKNETTDLVLEAKSDARVRLVLSDPAGKIVYDKTGTTHTVALAVTKYGTWRVDVRDSGSTTDVTGAFSRFDGPPPAGYTAL